MGIDFVINRLEIQGRELVNFLSVGTEKNANWTEYKIRVDQATELESEPSHLLAHCSPPCRQRKLNLNIKAKLSNNTLTN